MKENLSSSENKILVRIALRVSTIYFVLSSIWILISDKIVLNNFFGEDSLTRLQTLKGIFFVLVSSTVIFLLVLRSVRKINRLHREQENILSYFSAVYDKVSEDKIVKNAALIRDIRNAFDNDEFQLHYQIIKDTSKDRIHAVESLIRWYHPERGYIPPLDFISVAESTDLIYDLRDFVIGQAFKQKKNWRDRDIHIPKIAINMSPKGLTSDSFVEYIDYKMQEFDFKKGELIIEVTESDSIEDDERLMSNLKRLRQLGIYIALDDFGSGYSSLTRLKKLPIDYLKIDKEFIDNIHVDKNDQAIVESFTKVAHTMGMKVIVEGVEKQEQIDKVLELGCMITQGYYIAKPMVAENVEKIVKEI